MLHVDELSSRQTSVVHMGQVTSAALETSAAAGISRQGIYLAREKLECSNAISSLHSGIKVLEHSKVQQFK